MRLGWLWAVLVTLYGGVAPTIARAQTAPPDEAVEFYQRGRENYRAGRYREASVDLERALVMDPSSPTLAYNLARVYELLGEIERAIELYARYLELLPAANTDERERTQQTIERLQGALSEQQEQSVTPPPPPTPPVETRPEPRWITQHGVADVAFWATASATVAVVITGTVLGVLALQADQAAADFAVGRDGALADVDRADGKANALALAADISFGVAAAGALTATLLYAIRTTTFEVLPDNRASPAPVSVGLSPQGVFATVEGSF